MKHNASTSSPVPGGAAASDLSRRTLLRRSVGLGLSSLIPANCLAGARFAAAIEDRTDFNAPLIHAPDDPAQWQAFREELIRWRDETRKRVKYDDSLYHRPEFAWAQTCFACGFVMLFDETFYDRREGRYRLDEFLDDAKRDFGRFDAIVLWQAYPRIGLDDRNQFDFYRDAPGGLTGLRELVGKCHVRGVRVFIDYNPWDTGTRREGKSDIDALGEMVAAIDADGVFLDTLDKGAGGLRARLDQVRPGLALESEGALPIERICDHHLSWAQWFADSTVPGVLRNKWFERRHMLHQIARWDRDHTGELHTAWLNGTGMLVWENVFGQWVGWSERDKSILRAMLPVQRRFAKLLAGEGWTPLVRTEKADVYASQWRGDDGVRLWALVNRTEQPAEGALLRIPIDGQRFYDLTRGVAAEVESDGGEAVIPGRIGSRGIAAFVSGTERSLGEDFPRFLGEMAKLNERPTTDVRFAPRATKLTAVQPTSRVKPDAIRVGMITIPAVQLKMKTVFRVRECGFYESQDEEFVKSRYPRLHHERVIERDVALAAYAIDRTPVTNAEFAAFLAASGYRPRFAENFVRHWKGASAPPSELAGEPVVYVDLDDARAYARSAGKRLPTEEEWQHGAPAGIERRGIVWEWTESERSDGRTRFAILKGGSRYRAAGSEWYFDGGSQRPEFAAKMLLYWPGLDRCATVGFRCVVDLNG